MTKIHLFLKSARNKEYRKLIIVFFIGWISFFPEAVQIQYHTPIKCILFIIFIYFWLRKKIKITRKDLVLLLFILCLMGGVFSAKNKLVAIETYSNLALPLFSLYFLTSLFSEEDISFFAKTICFFSIFVSLLGIFDILWGRNFLYEIMYNPFYERYLIYPTLKRPLSTQFNPAPLGTYLLACFPFGLVLLKEKNIVFLLLGAISLLLNSSVLILTFSRAAFVGFIVTILFFLWHKQKKMLFMLFILTFILTVAISSFLEYDRGFDRFGLKGMLFGQEYTSPLSRYRIERVEMVFKMLKDHPIFGIGLNHIRIRFFDYYPGKSDVGYEWRIADNMYLTLLGETGIIGFTGFLTFIFFLFKNGLKSLKKLEGKKKDILLISLSAFIGLLINMTGYELFYWHTPFYLFCLISGLVRWIAK